MWGSCQVHLTATVRQELHHRDIDVVAIPGRLTPLVQPLDVSINRPFKMRMRHMWEDWTVHCEPSLTPAGHRRVASKELLVHWLVKAWNAIPCAMMEHSFKKCGVSNSHDSTKDTVLFDGVCPGKPAKTAFLDSDDESDLEGF